MSATIAQMSPRELKKMIEDIVEAKFEEKISAALADPDEGLELRPEIRERLLRQKERVAQGERGEDFEAVIAELGLS